MFHCILPQPLPHQRPILIVFMVIQSTSKEQCFMNVLVLQCNSLCKLMIQTSTMGGWWPWLTASVPVSAMATQPMGRGTSPAGPAKVGPLLWQWVVFSSKTATSWTTVKQLSPTILACTYMQLCTVLIVVHIDHVSWSAVGFAVNVSAPIDSYYITFHNNYTSIQQAKPVTSSCKASSIVWTIIVKNNFRKWNLSWPDHFLSASATPGTCGRSRSNCHAGLYVFTHCPTYGSSPIANTLHTTWCWGSHCLVYRCCISLVSYLTEKASLCGPK